MPHTIGVNSGYRCNMRTPALFRLLLPGAVLLLTLLAPAAKATYGEGDPRLERLYSSFISPCCWRENLTLHDSPQAVELRTRIGNMVAAGDSDQQIRDTLVAEFGPRILSLPEGNTGRWLFWTPAMVLAAGLMGLFVFLRRSKSNQTTPTTPGGLPPTLPPNWDRDLEDF